MRRKSDLYRRTTSLTEKSIPNLPLPAAGERAIEYSCNETRGLRLIVSATGGRRWQVKFTLYGRKRSLGLGGWPECSVRDARRRCIEVRGEALKGVDPVEGKREIKRDPLLREFAAEVLRNTKDKLRAHEDFEQRTRTWILPALGHLRLSQITHRDVEALHAKVRETRAGGTANRVLATLHRYLELAVRGDEIITTNVAKGITKFEETPRTTRLRAHEVKALLEALDTEPNRSEALALSALVLSGARIGELRQLRWENVDLERGYLFLRAETVKTRQARTIACNSLLLEVLKRAKKEIRHKKSVPWVFPGKGGRQMGCLRYCLERAKTKANLPENLTRHDLRRTYGSLCAEAGVPLISTSRLMGHSTPAVTARVYSLVDDDVLRVGSQQAIDRIGLGGSKTR